MIRLVLALSRALYGLFPRSFRDRFGADLQQDLEETAAAEARRGGPAGLRLLRRVAGDLVRELPRAWRRSSRREGTTMRWMDDVRYGLRGLARDRAFTAVVVLVLAAGIGSAAGVLALVDAYLYSGLPYPESERLMSLRGGEGPDWRDAGDVFDPPVSWDLDVFTLVDGDRPRMVRGAWVTPGWFEAYGVEPALGRAFHPSEAGSGGAAVAMIGHRLWQERWGGDPGVLGRTVSAFTSDRPDDAEVFTIVGVLPEGLWHFNAYTEFLAPLRAENPVYMGRLRSGLTGADAERALAARARAADPSLPADHTVDVESFHARYTAGVRPVLTAVGLAVALVLLVACGNAAMLLAVRAAGRQRSFAVRHALGAGRGRLVRQLLVEGLALSTVAAGLGLLGAHLATGALAGPIQARLGLSAPGGAAAIGIDGSVAAWTAVLAMGAGLVFALVPLGGALGGSPGRTLAAGGARGGAGSRGRQRLRDGLVAAEIALSLTLLVGAGLALRSARHLTTVDLGFRPEGVMTGQVVLRAASYPEPGDRQRFFRAVAERVRAMPEVESAAWVLRAPFVWSFGLSAVESEDAPVGSRGDAVEAVVQIVGEGYFETMGIELEEGRTFDERDGLEAEEAVVIGRGLARRLWPGAGSVVGRRLRGVADPGQETETWRRVVGVVDDVWNSVELGSAPDLYLPHGQVTPASATLVSRLRDGAPPVQAIEDRIHEVDPTVAFSSVELLDRATRAATAPSRLLAGVLGAFSAFAAVLAVLGLYGVVAWAAAQRGRDVAIRMALGADRGRVVRFFVLERVLVIGLGLLAGLGGGVALGRALAPELRGVEPGDPATLLATAALLGGAAMLATWLPARRASRAEPAAVLRED